MKREVIIVGIAALMACAPKAEHPDIVPVTYDRLYEEGWQAYARGDYATAEAKFDSILKYLDASRPEVYLAAALAQIPQKKTSLADGNISVALSILGEPFRSVVQIVPAEVMDLLPGETRVAFRTTGGFYPISGFSGGLGDYWMIDLLLADLPQRSMDSALVHGQVPLGFSGERVTFRLLGWNDDSVFLALGVAQGTAFAETTLVNPQDTVSVVYDTVYNVPGEGVVVETLVVLGTVNVQKIAQLPDLQDQLVGLFLVRDMSAVPTDGLTDLHILAYLAFAASAFVKGEQDPVQNLYSMAYAKAASDLVAERGQDFAYEPLPGMTLSRFRACRAEILHARAAFAAQLYYNAAVAVNRVLGQSSITPSFFPSVHDIQTLSEKINEAERLCVVQTTGG